MTDRLLSKQALWALLLALAAAAPACDDGMLELTPTDETTLSPNERLRRNLMLSSEYAEFVLDQGPKYAPPLSPRHLQGVFPPDWHVTQWWYVVRIDTRSVSGDLGPPEQYAYKTTYRFEVISAPLDPDGEYVIEIREIVLPEGQGSLPPERQGLRYGKGWFIAHFWARDGSLIHLRNVTRQAQRDPESLVDDDSGMGNGPHPYAGAEPGLWSDEVPFQAYSILPPRLENPLFLGWEKEPAVVRGWQIIRPTKDGLLFDITSTDLQGDRPGSVDEFRIEWRRGDPWWSSVTSVAPYANPKPDIKGAEYMDDRLVYGRLLFTEDEIRELEDQLPEPHR